MSAKSLQRTLEQERAQQAWACVQEVTNKPQEFKKKYGSLARKVPMLVLTNGLGQTLAFLLAKAKRHEPEQKRSVEAKAHDLLLVHLSNWVLSQVASSTPASNGDLLLQWVLQNDSAAYRRATIESLAFLTWLKRFAEAELPTED
jgi:CRISPR-associated protein Cmr5